MSLGASLMMSELGLSALSLGVLVLLALAFSSYVKIATVLAVLRTGLGVDSLPSAFVTGSLAVALSLAVMFPTLKGTGDAIDSSLAGKGSAVSAEDRAKALDAGIAHWKGFLALHAHEKEKERFLRLSIEMEEQQETKEGSKISKATVLPDEWRVLAPAFLVSELKEAFATCLSVFLPFLVIDLIVANLLVAVGLLRLDPLLVSFPFKLLLFVMVDGWTLIVENLVSSYSIVSG